MVTINYQTFGKKGFGLRLRIYLDGETKYIVVNKFLKGQLYLKHWNQKRQRFIPSAPYSEENNKALDMIAEKFLEAARTFAGTGMNAFFRYAEGKPKDDGGGMKLSDLISHVIAMHKKKIRDDGTIKDTFMAYEKLESKMKLYCQHIKRSYESVWLDEVDSGFINGAFDWIESECKGKGYYNFSQFLHATLNVANSNGWYDMAKVEKCRWMRNKKLHTQHKYRTLDEKQFKAFSEFDSSTLPYAWKWKNAELYHDFCIFIFYSCQSPCDAICLQKKNVRNIDGQKYLVFLRRKIDDRQDVECFVPVNSVMERIMGKYENVSKDGYIFPIRSLEKLRTMKTNNGDIKKFISYANLWLARVGELMGLDFRLHLYTFRHSGITNYLRNGVSPAFVSDLAGTDIRNLSKVYYNNRGDSENRRKVLSAIL